MNTKLLTGAGCLLLLAAALTPTALGHDDRTFTGSAPTIAHDANGVSGKYVGGAGPALADPTNYGNTIAGGSILCDLEVANFDATDEELVDGSSAGPGSLDETWDDGGLGGACHTNYGVAGFAHYDTSGCSGTARANNGVGAVFLGASCDWKTTVGGTPQSTILTTCVVNSLLPPPDALAVVDCVVDFVFCLSIVNPTGCAAGGFEACGADHVADGINYGIGSAAYPHTTAHQGDVAFDYDSDGDGIMDASCSSSDATAAVFVFDAVTATVDETVPSVTNLSVRPAGAGEIWQT